MENCPIPAFNFFIYCLADDDYYDDDEEDDPDVLKDPLYQIDLQVILCRWIYKKKSVKRSAHVYRVFSV